MSDPIKPLNDAPASSSASPVPASPDVPAIPRLEANPTQALPPLIDSSVPAGDAPDDGMAPGSDAEAYAALKARRAERRKKKLIRRGIAVGAIAGVLALGALGVAVFAPKDDAESGVVTDFAMRGDYETAIGASGTLQPLSSTVIAPETGGTIAEIRVAAGQAVNKGDVLMVIRNDELDRAVKEAERSLNSAKSALAAARRGDAVVDPETGQQTTAVSQDAVDEATFALEGARAAYDAAVAAAAARTVVAPIAGNVVAMNAKVGAPVSAATENGQPLMQIADLSQMKVTIQVSEEQIATVAKDQQASITFPAFEDLTLTGKVSNIASTATGDAAGMYYGESGAVQFAVDVLIEAPDARLKPGMTANVDLMTEHLADVVMVPSIALMSDDGEHYYVVVETDPETSEHTRVDVQVVAQNDDFAVVGKSEDAPEGENPGMARSPLTGDEALVISGAMLDGEMDGGAVTGSGTAVLK